MWLTCLFLGVTALFVFMALSTLWHMRWVQRLPSWETLSIGAATAGHQSGPRCSIIVAARDEESRIEGTIRHLLALKDVDAEFIVVDDRSVDGTPEILRRLAAEDSRLQIKRVELLPEGWLGKCHACHVGASAATGEWLLFTDADCWLKPDVLARALRLAQREGAEHLTLTPGTVVESPGTRAWHLLFLISLANWFSGVNRDKPKSYIGIGAFNLVRKDAYRECGGYERLRLTVVDDVKLGLLLRRAGKRSRAFLGVDDVECHWGTTVANMVHVMEKNYFAITNFSVLIVLLGTSFTLLLFGLLIAGLFSGTWAGLAASLSPFLLVVPWRYLARRINWNWTSALLVPFMLPVFLYSLLNSTYITLRQGGVRWRGTFYPLRVLRAANVN